MINHHYIKKCKYLILCRFKYNTKLKQFSMEGGPSRMTEGQTTDITIFEHILRMKPSTGKLYIFFNYAS